MESKEEQSIKSVVKAYDEAWNNKNVRTIVSCFTDDAVFINPWGNVYRGKGESQKFTTKPSR